MALDLFVMPLSRYLCGDYTTATERLAEKTGTRYARIGAEKAKMSLAEANEMVESIKGMLRKQLGPEIRWNDAGDTVFAEQFSLDNWHALRAFAANVTQPVPGFIFDSGSSQHPGLTKIWSGTRSPYLHLIRHHDNQGYYLPTNFDQPFILPLFDAPDDLQPRAGSSLALLRELNDLGRRIGMSKDLGEAGWTDQFAADDPLESVKYGWAFMRNVAKISVARKLPIIFDG